MRQQLMKKGSGAFRMALRPGLIKVLAKTQFSHVIWWNMLLFKFLIPKALGNYLD